MRVRYSFSSRRTRHIDKIRKQRQKYPSLAEKIVAISDIILQVLDARFIQDTRNLELEKTIQNQKKKIIFVLNKADLINKNKIKKKELEEIKPYVFVSATKRTGSKDLRNLIKTLAKQVEKIESRTLKGDKIKDKGGEEQIVVGVIGYPNTGKSTLINLLIGKSSAGTGAEAGFTKGIQKLKLAKDIILLDSPGVIPQKEYSGTKQKAIAKHTKVSGRSYSQVKNPEQIIAELIKEYSKTFDKHYKIKSKANAEILIEELGRKKGFLKKAGEINEDKTARFILKEWQEGKIKI